MVAAASAASPSLPATLRKLAATRPSLPTTLRKFGKLATELLKVAASRGKLELVTRGTPKCSLEEEEQAAAGRYLVADTFEG